MSTKDITKFSLKQREEFLKSFDTVFCDLDGVLQILNKPVKGAHETLTALQNQGKQVYIVTNNSMAVEYYYETVEFTRLNLTSDHVIDPIKVIIWYLKKIEFRDEVLAIVPSRTRNLFKEAGIRLTEQPQVFPRDPFATIKEVLDRPSVKAVVIDFDVTCNWAMLALAISCLQRKDVLYITGAKDDHFRINEAKIMGPGPIVDLITAQIGREPIACGKPSQKVKDYILEKCNVTNLERCIFIGDTIDQDMKFASICGCIKLLVGTGVNTLEQSQQENDTCPDYYLPSLGHLFSVCSDAQYIANKS